jgi:hypothetical protein
LCRFELELLCIVIDNRITTLPTTTPANKPPSTASIIRFASKLKKEMHVAIDTTHNTKVAIKPRNNDIL